MGMPTVWLELCRGECHEAVSLERHTPSVVMPEPPHKGAPIFLRDLAMPARKRGPRTGFARSDATRQIILWCRPPLSIMRSRIFFFVEFL